MYLVVAAEPYETVAFKVVKRAAPPLCFLTAPRPPQHPEALALTRGPSLCSLSSLFWPSTLHPPISDPKHRARQSDPERQVLCTLGAGQKGERVGGVKGREVKCPS